MTEEWIKKMWYIHTIECYSAIKKEQNWVICRDLDGPRDCYTDSSQKEKKIYCILTYICGIWRNWYAATAKSLQSCSTLCNPIDSSPPGPAVPRILQARTLEWVAISSSSAWKWKVKVKSLSHVWLLATPWTAAYQAPPSMGFSRQEYWSGLPLPSPRNWYRWSYLQSRKRDTDIENKCMDTKEERGSGMNWDIGIDIYTLPILSIK